MATNELPSWPMPSSMHSPEYVARMRSTIQFVVRDVLRMSNTDFARALSARLGRETRSDQVGRWLNGPGLANVPYSDIYHAILEMAGVDLSPEGIRGKVDESSPEIRRRLEAVENALLSSVQADLTERDEARRLAELSPALGDPNQYVRVPEAARRLNVTEQAIRLRIARGRLKAYRRGRNRVVKLSDLGPAKLSS